MSERYSKGGEAQVFRVTERERLLFPYADLVRRESSTIRCTDQANSKAPEFFSALFYLHKIAYILFPENFINVVALQHEVTGNKVIYNLYSRKASIPDEHAVYSDHMLVTPFARKTSIDNCDTCKKHEDFHRKNDLQRRAAEVYHRTSEAGFFGPYSDSSDYCLTKEGNLVFFEIEENDLDVTKLKHYIESLPSTDIRRDLVKGYVNRYISLFRKIGFELEPKKT